MNLDDWPWVTTLLTAWMIGLYLFDPSLNTGAKYFFLSPWTHSGFGHFWNNMAFFMPLGVYAERRVDSLPFLAFAALIPYLALQLPFVWGFGGLSQGASGLTKSLTGYAVPALLVDSYKNFRSLGENRLEWRKLGLVVIAALAIVFLMLDSFQTIQRFGGFEARPEGVSVASHFVGLVLGILWFSWRGWRYGIPEGA